MIHGLRRWFTLISIGGVLASCVPIVDSRGHGADRADFKQIVVGQSSPEDVMALLGSPSVRSTYGPETWYYITEKKETWGMFAPEVTDQHVTAITFDANHTVATIEERSAEDGKEVQFVSETTPTEGHHMTVIEQMLGNFGRFATPGRSIDPRTLGH